VTSRLDVSSTSVYSLCVSATDDRHNSSVTINVTVNPPVDGDLIQFSQPFYVFDVPEDASLGVVVGRIEASVAVVGHRASSSPLTYAVASRWASAAFRLNATYGILTIASSLDYETVSLCHLLCTR